MPVREIGEHLRTVLFRDKKWTVDPPSHERAGHSKAVSVTIEHRVDRNDTKIKRLQAKVNDLKPLLDRAKAELESADLSKWSAQNRLDEAWVFKGQERQSLSTAEWEYRTAQRKYDATLEVWNPLIRQLNSLLCDPGRYVVRAQANAWSYGGKLYQITHVHPSEEEATTLIAQFVTQRKQDFVRAQDEVHGSTPRPLKDEAPGAGIVYVLHSYSVKGLLKIGGTSRSAEERAKELSTTGVPTPYMVLYSHAFSDWEEAEGRVHARLRRYRINEDREFFSVEPKVAIDEIRRIADDGS